MTRSEKYFFSQITQSTLKAKGDLEIIISNVSPMFPHFNQYTTLTYKKQGYIFQKTFSDIFFYILINIKIKNTEDFSVCIYNSMVWASFSSTYMQVTIKDTKSLVTYYGSRGKYIIKRPSALYKWLWNISSFFVNK